MSKVIEGHPFGSQSCRFTLNGVHPNLLYTGKMPYETNPASQLATRLGPGVYDILRYSEFSDLNVTRSAEGPNWERAVLMEKTARMPHLLYQETFKKKLEDKRRVGPGYYSIKSGIEVDSGKPQSNRGMLDALSERFSYEIPNNNPGPGAYGISDELIENKRKNKPGKVPLFERSKESRSLPSVGCEVPPGTYKHKNSIDELLKKKVSNRGPYDLFSENRSAPTKAGHFAQDLDKQLGPGQYDLESFVDLTKKSDHAKHGKFGKLSQYPTLSGERIASYATCLQPRNPKWPGPGYYDPQELSKAPTVNPPFLSSSQRSDQLHQKRLNGNFNGVGVGRFDITRFQESENKNGHGSIFNTKTPQITDMKDEKYLKERIKPHNLDHIEKQNLFLTGNISG